MARSTRIGRYFSAHQDAAIGLGLLAACAVLFWMTSHFPEVPAMLSQNVPPTFFPRLVLAVIALLSLLLILKELKGLKGLKAQTTTGRPKQPIKRSVFVTAAIITSSIAFMQPLGMLLTVSILAVVMPLAWGERRYRRVAVLALALPLAIYLVFTLALGIRFPPGILAMFLS